MLFLVIGCGRSCEQHVNVYSVGHSVGCSVGCSVGRSSVIGMESWGDKGGLVWPPAAPFHVKKWGRGMQFGPVQPRNRMPPTQGSCVRTNVATCTLAPGRNGVVVGTAARFKGWKRVSSGSVPVDRARGSSRTARAAGATRNFECVGMPVSRGWKLHPLPQLPPPPTGR